MRLELRRVRMPLASFVLEMDVVLEGQVTAFFGPSGAGKTSVLDLVAGLRTPKSARIRLDDVLLTDTESDFFLPPRARGIGYVPQDLALFPHLSVRRNVLYGARGPAEDEVFSLRHVSEVLEIHELLERGIERLSGGEKQRVALARALLTRPRLLLLDEPLAGLDASLKAKAQQLLRRLRTEFGVPILYVSHVAEEIMELCDHMVVLERGRVTRSGEPQQLFETTPVPTLRLRGRETQDPWG